MLYPELVDMTYGNPDSVEFDWERIWTFMKQRKDVNAFRHLNYVHVHPPDCGTGYSGTDLNCVRGHLQAFGIDRVIQQGGFPFWIITFDNEKPFDYSGRAELYHPVFRRETGWAVQLESRWKGEILERIPLYPVTILKLLSYRGPYVRTEEAKNE